MNRRSVISSTIIAGVTNASRNPLRSNKDEPAVGPYGAQLRATWVDSRADPGIEYSIRVTWYLPKLGSRSSMNNLKSWQRYPEDQFTEILGVDVFRALSWAEFPLPPVGENPRYDNVYWVARENHVGPCIFSSCGNIFIDQVATHSLSARRGMEGMSSPTDALITDVLERMASRPANSPLDAIGEFLPTEEHLNEAGLLIKIKEEYEEL